MDTRNMPKMFIFEGPDCCGKTTQSRFLQKQFKNSIYIHFPRKNKEVSQVYVDTTATLYNKEFMEAVKTDTNKRYMLMDVLKRNVTVNGDDKIDFLNYFVNKINNINVSGTLNFLDLANFEFTVDGERVFYDTNGSSEKISWLLKNLDAPDTAIILDRFVISGKCYNEFIPVQMVSKYLSDCSWASDVITNIETAQRIVDSKIFFLMNNFDCKTFIFGRSEILANKAAVDERRVNDAYDANNDIKVFSDKFFKETKISSSPGKLISLNTDLCMNDETNKKLFAEEKPYKVISDMVNREYIPDDDIKFTTLMRI